MTGLVVLAIAGLFWEWRAEGLWFVTAMGALGGAVLAYVYCGRFWKYLKAIVGLIGES